MKMVEQGQLVFKPSTFHCRENPLGALKTSQEKSCEHTTVGAVCVQVGSSHETTNSESVSHFQIFFMYGVGIAHREEKEVNQLIRHF